jgi:FkbM family methyltransferase
MKLKGLIKPEYLLKPGNIMSRLRYRRLNMAGSRVVQLRGHAFHIDPDEVIGRQILHFGLFDLLVTEALFRLTDTGETAADVGANIGYMACVLADRAGSSGMVYAFEPHPDLYRKLQLNTAGRAVRAVQAAVSDHDGQASLNIPQAFADNRGIATLERTDDAGDAIEVAAVTLDSAFPPDTAIGVLKIDIEGHELAALRGAKRMIGQGRIRDIVFEEHNTRSSPVVALLASSGYEVFRLHKRFFGPELRDPGTPVKESTWESPSFLATRDAERAKARFAKGGWACLRA